MKKILCLSLVLSLYVNGFAQDKSLVDKAKAGYRISNAQLEMEDRNFRGAAAMLKDILLEFPNDPKACYLLAECLYELKDFWQARAYIDTSIIAGPPEDAEHLLTAGKVYHSVAALDKAEIYYEKFRNTRKEGFLFEGELEKFLGECEFARDQMAHPKGGKLKPLGTELNSKYDEYAPSVTGNGEMIYFTSRRPENEEGGQVDQRGDYKYFEDIYEIKRENGAWTAPKKVDGPINTEKYDAVLSVSPGGDEMYVYVNTGKNGGDIYYSAKDKAGLWSAPEAMPDPINSSYYEGSLSITADGNTIYFISERPKGYGFGDIWRVTKGADGDWGLPENLGPAVNTPFDEKFVYIHPDGKTLFFASTGHEGLGSYDIYRSILVGDEFTSPVNLGYPINTVNEESTFSFTSDGKTMYLAAIKQDGKGERDLYEVDLTSAGVVDAAVADANKGLVLGTVVTEGARKIPDATIIVVEDGGTTPVVTTAADNNGRYEVKLPLGKAYQIKVTSEGYAETVEKVMVKPAIDGKTMIVKHVVLRSEAKPAKAGKAEEKEDEEKEEKEEDEE